MKLKATKQPISMSGYSLLVIVDEDKINHNTKFPIPDVSITMKDEIVDKIVELINSDGGKK